jgi:cytidylate kinase
VVVQSAMVQSAAPFIIAIDGPAASGKGTLAKGLASHYRLAHLDTGLLYRAVGLALLTPAGGAVRLSPDQLRQQLDPDQAAAVASQLRLEPLQNLDYQAQLRAEDVSIAASLVAAMPAVRAALRQLQVDFALHPPHQAGDPSGAVMGAVVEGRDIGSVIAPQAQVKLFIIADAQVRAERRFRQLQQLDLANSAATANNPPMVDRILADIHARDASDAAQMAASRAAAGQVLDNSQVTPAELTAQAIAYIDPYFRAWQGQPLDL